VIAVDASAIVAIALGEPERGRFTDLILADPAPLASVATILEVTLKLCRTEQTTGRLDLLVGLLGLQIVPTDVIQLRAAQNAYLAYGKGRHPAALNFGDCFTYALAKTRQAPLLFKGTDFARTDIVSALHSR